MGPGALVVTSSKKNATQVGKLATEITFCASEDHACILKIQFHSVFIVHPYTPSHSKLHRPTQGSVFETTTSKTLAQKAQEYVTSADVWRQNHLWECRGYSFWPVSPAVCISLQSVAVNKLETQCDCNSQN